MAILSETEKKDFDMQVRLASQDDKDFWIETLVNAATEDDVKRYENLLAKRKGELGISSETAVTSKASREGFKGSKKERRNDVFSWSAEHVNSDGTITSADRSAFREKFECSDSTVNRWLKEYRRSIDSEHSDLPISALQKDNLSSSAGKQQKEHNKDVSGGWKDTSEYGRITWNNVSNTLKVMIKEGVRVDGLSDEERESILNTLNGAVEHITRTEVGK